MKIEMTQNKFSINPNAIIEAVNEGIFSSTRKHYADITIYKEWEKVTEYFNDSVDAFELHYCTDINPNTKENNYLNISNINQFH